MTLWTQHAGLHSSGERPEVLKCKLSHRVAADFAQLHCQITQIGQVFGVAAIQQCPNLQHQAISIKTPGLMAGECWTIYASDQEVDVR